MSFCVRLPHPSSRPSSSWLTRYFSVPTPQAVTCFHTVPRADTTCTILTHTLSLFHTYTPQTGIRSLLSTFPGNLPTSGRIDFDGDLVQFPCLGLRSAARWMGSSSGLPADDNHYCRCKGQSVVICAGNGFSVPLHTRWRPDRIARALSEQIQNKWLNIFIWSSWKPLSLFPTCCPRML